MGVWTVESRPVKQITLSLTALCFGVLLMYGFQNFDDPGSLSNQAAGFYLGALLVIIGVPGVAAIGIETVTVDPARLVIKVENRNLFRRKVRDVNFSDVAGMRIGSFGTASGGATTYYVSLSLKSGETVPLFYPAYYDGRWDRHAAEGRMRKLGEYIG